MEKNKRVQKLQLKEIINDLDIIDLKSFMYQYAKKDKHFEIAFKSHFLSRLNLGDKGLKYKRILDEIIKPKTINNQKISPSLSKIISFVLNDFTSQMHDCLSTENYMEVFYITSSCLEKIAYLQNKFNLRIKSIESSRIEFLKGVDILVKQDLAPKFRNEMESYFKELILRSYYIPEPTNLISILDNNQVLVEDEKSQIITNLIDKNSMSSHELDILKTCIQLATPFPELANKLLHHYSHAKIFECLKDIIEERDFYITEFIISNNKVNFDYNIDLLLTLEKIAKDDHLMITEKLVKLEIDSVSPIELKFIVEKLSNSYLRKEFKKIKSWVDHLPFGMKSSIYFKSQNFVKLVKLLSVKNDFEWLKVYDIQLIEASYQDEVEQLYFDKLYSYLNNHIGSNSRIYLEKVAKRLTQIGQLSMQKRIFKKLSTHFEHRKTIKSILN